MQKSSYNIHAPMQDIENNVMLMEELDFEQESDSMTGNKEKTKLWFVKQLNINHDVDHACR